MKAARTTAKVIPFPAARYRRVVHRLGLHLVYEGTLTAERFLDREIAKFRDAMMRSAVDPELIEREVAALRRAVEIEAHAVRQEDGAA